MNPVVVKNVRIGEGMPKVIAPIVGVTREAILSEASALGALPVDMVEWRIDWYERGSCADAVIDTAAALQQILGDMPLLCTFRTKKEGGAAEIVPSDYAALLEAVCRARAVDLIDVEIFTGDSLVREIIDCAHAHGVKVVGSNHDFFRTPDRGELVARLTKMAGMGADIPKIAVMPTCREDVLVLLSATLEASQKLDRPLITMSMSGTGAISRMCGEVFGSSCTFGSASRASAPGQVPVERLKSVLDVVHGSL